MDSYKLCRVCLQEGVIPIFKYDGIENLASTLCTIGDIKISVYDPYPKSLCHHCHALLQDAITFRNTAQQSQKQLKIKMELKEHIRYINFFSDSENNEYDDNRNCAIGDVKMYTYQIPELKTKMHDHYATTAQNVEALIDVNQPKNHTCLQTELGKVINNFLGEPTKENDDHRTPHHIASQKMVTNQQCKGLEQKNRNQFEDSSEMGHIKVFNVVQDNDNEGLISDDKIANMLKRITCEICDVKLNSYLEYSEHKLSNHIKYKPEKKLKHNNTYCKKCSIMFSSYEKYSDHNLKEHVNKKVSCSVCNKTFNRKILKRHMDSHKADFAFMCDVCGKGFTQKATLERHHSIHSNDFPFQCSLCPYKGRRSEDMRLHLRTHTGERPYICQQCEARFKSKSSLNKHMLTHKAGWDFKCEECGRGFRAKKELINHNKAIHAGIKGHSCDYCDNVYGYRSHLLRHQRIVHNMRTLKGGITPAYLQAD